MKMHKSITPERVTAAVEEQMATLSDPGFCIACGDDADQCEPDAQNYKCESCGENKVFGAEELLFHL